MSCELKHLLRIQNFVLLKKELKRGTVKKELLASIQLNEDMVCRYILCNICTFDSAKEQVEVLISCLNSSLTMQNALCAKAIAWKIVRVFVQKIDKSIVYDVWPGFECICNIKHDRVLTDSTQNVGYFFCSSNVVIVVELNDDAPNDKRDERLHSIVIKFKKPSPNSHEAFLVSKEIDRIQQNEKIPLDTFKGIPGSEAEQYFSVHSKLTLISPSPLKSKNYKKGHIFETQPCIQFYCRIKGIIPIGEPHFPFHIDRVPVDVLEGYPQLFVEELRHGSKLFSMSRSGTLGGFVMYLGEAAFLTCAHVIFDREHLLTTKGRQQLNAKPTIVYCLNRDSQTQTPFPCGVLRNFVFTPDKSNETSIDAAVVKIDTSMANINPDSICLCSNRTKLSYQDLGMFDIKKTVKLIYICLQLYICFN